MERFEHLMQLEWMGNTALAWLIALGVAVLTTLALLLVRWLLHSRLQALAKRTVNDVDDLVVALVGATPAWFLALVGLYAATVGLVLADQARSLIRGAVVLALLFQAGRWGMRVLDFVLERQRKRRNLGDASGTATFSLLRFVGLSLIWTLVTLMALDNLGFDVTALIAGLGVGGIAVALAAQNILGDLFASLSIALDKPFAVKDFLTVGDFMGTVERIGIKTTRLRSLSGEQLVFSNTDLLGSRIRNYGRMFERRVPFTLGVTYQTPRALLEKIPGVLRAAVEAQGGEQVRFDRSHFKGYGSFSLDFETVYFVLSPDYAKSMDIQQTINLAIHEAFERDGIEFAYPTQTLFVAKEAV